MSRLRKILFAICILVSHGVLADNATQFVAVDIYLESSEPIAAWQFELSDAQGTMQVVGVERGESAAYERAPYYDREAVRLGTADRIVVADYSLANASELPNGRTRIATIHLLLDSRATDDIVLQLVTATAHSGDSAEASIEFETQTGSSQ